MVISVSDNWEQYQQEWLSSVKPKNWVNPQPKDNYDLIVIGAGTAGLVIAAGAAGLDIGLKIALVEKNVMGGDCLNFGCVPSKSLIRSARAIAEVQQAKNWGVGITEPIKIDFSSVMERMAKVRAEMSVHDSVERFQGLGIDVFLGEAHFLNNHQIQVESLKLNYKKAAITTGTKAFTPNIPGLSTADFLTNKIIFNLTELPNRLAIIGGGPIGCELAQTFQRFGSQVALFHNHSQLLNKEAQDAAIIIQNTFIKEGVQLFLESKIQAVEKRDNNYLIHYTINDQISSITVDKILVAVGRSPNVQALNLEKVGVKYDHQKGIEVNDYLQTSNPNIYAAGDICLNWKFTHAADAAARIVIKNMWFSPWGLGRSKLSDLTMPWVTYTEPEIAQVGLNEASAQRLGLAFQTIKIPFEKVDRAILDGEIEGFIKILYKTGSDQILGATIVANHAGEMISEITTAIAHNIGLSKLSKVIHPYPTQAESIKKAADAYQKTLLTAKVKSFLRFLTNFA